LTLSDISADIETIQQSLIYIKVNEVLEKPATIENIIYRILRYFFIVLPFPNILVAIWQS
jgi:hypothetical protein